MVVLSRDPDLTEMYVEWLRECGFVGLAGERVADVINFAATAPVVGIILDVVRSEDWCTAEQLRDAEVTRSIPVVVLTGWIAADGRFRTRAWRAGAAAFVAKPCPPSLVTDVLARVRRGERRIDHVTVGSWPGHPTSR